MKTVNTIEEIKNLIINTLQSLKDDRIIKDYEFLEIDQIPF